MDLPRAWTLFGGASLALMGVSLAAGARRHAADHLAWRRQWRQASGAPEPKTPEGRGLLAACRVGGALLALAGLLLACAGAVGRVLAAPRFVSASPRLLGAALAACGLALGASRLVGRANRGPRFLDAEPSAARPFDERLADAAGWALCALWAAFGLRLLLGYRA